jgi:hypothetical protein
MPKFNITAPDGTKYSVVAPEGATEQDALARVQQQHQGDQRNDMQETLAGTRDVVGQLPRGIAGAAEQTAGDVFDVFTGKPLKDAYRRLSNLVSGKEPTHEEEAANLPYQSGEKLQAATPWVRDQPETAAGEFSRTFGGMVAPFGPGGKGSGAGRLASAVGSSLGLEAGRKAAEGTPYEGVAELGGAVLGGHAVRAPNVAGRTVRPPEPSARHQARVAELRGFGVEPSAGEVTGSESLRKAEGSIGNAPGAGGAASRQEASVGNQITSAVVREMGSSADPAAVDMDRILDANFDRMGKTYERVLPQLGIEYGPKMLTDLTDIVTDLRDEGLDDATVNRIHQQVKNVLKTFQDPAGGTRDMPGLAFQSLTKKGSALAEAIDSDNSDVSRYAMRIREALTDGVRAYGQRPGASQTARRALAEFEKTNREYYTTMIAGKAVAGPGEAAGEGRITPQRLRALITGTADDRINYALQRSNLARLARAGVSVLSPLPNSQTAERNLLISAPSHIVRNAIAGGASVGGGGGFAVGGPVGAALGAVGGAASGAAGALAPGMLGRLMMSKRGQAWLKAHPEAMPPSTLRSAIGTELDTPPPSPEQVLDNPSGIPVL